MFFLVIDIHRNYEINGLQFVNNFLSSEGLVSSGARRSVNMSSTKIYPIGLLAWGMEMHSQVVQIFLSMVAKSVNNILRLRQHCHHFHKQHFHMYFLVWKYMNFTLDFTEVVPKVPIDNNPALVQIMACRRPGNKPLPGLIIMVPLVMLTWVTQPQWVNFCSVWTASHELFQGWF